MAPQAEYTINFNQSLSMSAEIAMVVSCRQQGLRKLSCPAVGGVPA
jgi:hypothetical protein